MSTQALCAICGQPMPLGEEMFAYHGYSGPCPAAPKIPTSPRSDMDAANTDLVILTNQCEALNKALTASRAENARLREAIERAPHEPTCMGQIDVRVWPEERKIICCTCWKRDALGGE